MRRLYSWTDPTGRFEYPYGVQVSDRPLFSFYFNEIVGSSVGHRSAKLPLVGYRACLCGMRSPKLVTTGGDPYKDTFG